MLFALALALAAPAQAAAPPARSTATDAPAAASVAAVKLARLMRPRDLLIAAEVREFDKNFAKTMLTAEGSSDLEKQFPGIINAVTKAIRPMIARHTGISVDRSVMTLASFLDGRFSAGELGELGTFYASPTGQRILSGIAGGIDTSGQYQAAVSEMKTELTVGDVEQQVLDAARGVSSKMSAADQAALTAFMAKPVFAKLALAQPGLRQVIVDSANAPDLALEKEMDALIAKSFADYIAASESATK